MDGRSSEKHILAYGHECNPWNSTLHREAGGLLGMEFRQEVMLLSSHLLSHDHRYQIQESGVAIPWARYIKQGRRAEGMEKSLECYIPSEILWRLAQHSIPTTDVLNHRNMADSPRRVLCGRQD